jgi:hypothetical protein
MSIEATILASAEKWRIVKQVDGERVTYLLEKLDGADGLGVERWKAVNIGDGSVDTLTRQLRDYIIQLMVKQESAK